MKGKISQPFFSFSEPKSRNGNFLTSSGPYSVLQLSTPPPIASPEVPA